MKRILALILCIIMLTLSACRASEEVPVTLPPIVAEVDNEPALQTTTAMAAVTVPVTTETTFLENGMELFSYSYQYMNLIFPDAEVADKVTIDFLNRVDATQAESQSILQAAQTDYLEAQQWIPYFYRVMYNPMRIDRGVLSLFGMQNSYSGGMHGNVSCIAANYDMLTGDILTFGSIMHADAKKEDFIEIVIDKLSAAEDAYYLYEDFDVAVHQRLGGDENLYEDFYFTTTGLNFFFSPYEIAPYSSGIITVEIPYEELTGLIYDGYFPDERQQVDGTMQAGLFMDTNMEQFNNMAEIILPDGEELYTIYPSGPVENIRVHVRGDGTTIPDYTVFGALEMADQDAIVLYVPKGQENSIEISYQSSGETHQFALVD